jgi:hypothetical protein
MSLEQKCSGAPGASARQLATKWRQRAWTSERPSTEAPSAAGWRSATARSRWKSGRRASLTLLTPPLPLVHAAGCTARLSIWMSRKPPLA